MDEKKKYYTPTIDEFYCGFEYEHMSKNEVWLQCYYNTMYDQRSDSELDELNMVKERVKYLDREDIESLGFSFIENFYGGVGEYYKSNNGFYIHTYPENVFRIYNLKSKEPSTCMTFYGKIKNKSELEKILKMVGAISDGE